MLTKHLSSNILNALLPLIKDAVSIVDIEGKVLFWNEGAEYLYGVKKDKIIGKRISSFFNKSDLVILNMLHTEKVINNEYHQPQADKHVLISSSPIYDEQNNLQGAISIEKDISQTVKLNEQLSSTSDELRLLKTQIEHSEGFSQFNKIIGNSDAITQTIGLAKRVAKTDATVYISGESGVGKEMFALAIHETSPRCDHSFIPINCGAIPEALFESELFGYEKGAFSGASAEGKPGKIELAHHGTLFLDEVAELPLDMQVKLLRALQEGQIHRIGGTEPIRVNVRILAATNKDLYSMVKEGRFRSDLYYRLNVFPIEIPPLRHRIEDLPYFITNFFHDLSKKHGKHTPTMTQDAIDFLSHYHWPGNVRELRNILERLIILDESGQITRDHVIEHFPGNKEVPLQHKNKPTKSHDYKDTLKQVEKETIQNALKETYGNKSAAASKLGMSRSTLYKRLKEYELES